MTNSSSQSDSPVHEETTTPVLSSAGWESEEEREKDPPGSSLSQTSNEIHVPHPAALGGGVSVTPEPGLMDLNEEFPPLSKHGRSQSDPQVSSGERQQPRQDSKSSQTGNVSRLTQSLTSQMQRGTYLKKPLHSSGFTPSVPPIEGSPVSNERERLPKAAPQSASGSEKLPFASPAKRNQSEPSVLESIKSGKDLERTPGARLGRLGSEDGLIASKVPTSLAVGSDIEPKVSKTVY